MGAAAEEARRIAADVVRVELPEHPKLVWYDRAVFHFLADPEARVR